LAINELKGIIKGRRWRMDIWTAVGTIEVLIVVIISLFLSKEN